MPAGYTQEASQHFRAMAEDVLLTQVPRLPMPCLLLFCVICQPCAAPGLWDCAFTTGSAAACAGRPGEAQGGAARG